MMNNAITSEEILTALKNVFPNEYVSGIGVFEGYTLEQHTRMVMKQFDKYFATDPNIQYFVSIVSFRKFLALHDIGKPAAVNAGEKSRQHEYTIPILKDILPKIGVTTREAKIFIALIHSDEVGAYLQSKMSLKQLITLLRDDADSIGMAPLSFTTLELTLYMVDAGSYTEDAGGMRSLDYLFVFRPSFMMFSEVVNDKILALIRTI
jgi:hypothetical protein